MLPSVADVDVDKLSPDSRDALEIAQRMTDEGLTLEEAAAAAGTDRKTLGRAFDRLAGEWRALAGIAQLPDLTQDEYDALKESIRVFGQFVPILLDRDGEVIDGRHRMRACRELGLTPMTKHHILPGNDPLDSDERERLALVLNLARRQVGASTRRGVIEAELLRDPARSDRSIATAIGVSPTTVGHVRAELEARGRVSRLDTRTDTAGRAQPAHKPPRPPARQDSEGCAIGLTVPAELVAAEGAWFPCKAVRVVDGRLELRR